MWGQVEDAECILSVQRKGSRRTAVFSLWVQCDLEQAGGWCSTAQWRSEDAASCCPRPGGPFGPLVMPSMWEEDQSILSKLFWKGLSLYRCVFTSFLDFTLKMSLLGKSREMQLWLANFRVDLNKDSTLKINPSSPDALRHIQVGCAHFWLNAPV